MCYRHGVPAAIYLYLPPTAVRLVTANGSTAQTVTAWPMCYFSRSLRPGGPGRVRARRPTTANMPRVMPRRYRPGPTGRQSNRLYFTMTSDTSHALYPSNTSGGVQIGYFVRSHDNSAVSNQGSHYYSFVDAGVYTGQTLYFVVNRKMQHNNTGSPTDVYPEDPEWNSCCHGQGNSSPVHFWDGETTFYIGAGPNLGGWTGNFTLGPMTMGTTSGEPDDFVSALTGTFTGSNSAVVRRTPTK